MSKVSTESHVVDFWCKPFRKVQDHEVPQTTVCNSVEEAIALESRFHTIGWPARAMTLATYVARFNVGK